MHYENLSKCEILGNSGIKKCHGTPENQNTSLYIATMINDKDLYTIITIGVGAGGERGAEQSPMKGMRVRLFVQPIEVSSPEKQVELDNPR